MRLAEIQTYLAQLGLDAWLLYDFQGSNPIARSVAGLGKAMITRRWCVLVPRSGSPVWLHHRIESQAFRALDGEKRAYANWAEWNQRIAELVQSCRRVALEYSPNGEIPYVSRVDGGFLELLRRSKAELVSSAELVQFYEARWSPAALREHEKAAEALNRIKDRAFDFIRGQLKDAKTTSEHEVQQQMVATFRELGLVTNCPPIVAVNHNCSDPHYLPGEVQSQPVRTGDFLLLDLWGKTPAPEAVYADITWVAFLGSDVPPRHREVFEIVARARDRGVEFIGEACKAGRIPRGFEVDDQVRKVISDAGYGEFFFHRTGHSIGIEDHGNGVNMDNFETHDTRPLVPGVGFSIEPGIYLPDFGIRSEINVFMEQSGPRVTTLPVQQEIERLKD